MILRKILIKIFYKLTNNHQLDYLKYLSVSSSQNYEVMQKKQFSEVKKILEYSYAHVPFYRQWFDQHQVDTQTILNFEDFRERIPVLTKADIIGSYSLFKTKSPTKYLKQSTGGSTGQTLKYRMSKKDWEMGSALLIRGMGQGGYRLGDSLLILAGGSLVKQKKRKKFKITPRLLNHYKVSSYGLTSQNLNEIVFLVRKKKIAYLRGYASSIFLLADHCREQNMDLSFKAVFSTAERLLDKQRTVIEAAFRCKVYDQYGLNDGGVSAYEHNNQSGWVVDMERSYVEVTEGDSEDKGRILGTTLYNYAFPFIRYDTGDRGIMEVRNLKSGVRRPVITKLLGRETEYLILNNRKIGSPVLTVLMGNTNAEKYRIIQKTENAIEIQIKKGENYSQKDEEFIKESFKDNCGPGIAISFRYMKTFENLNKHKFIVREIENQQAPE